MAGRMNALITVGILVAMTSRLPAVDFVRGDVNGDGKLTLADCYFMVNWVYRGGPAPQCLSAADYSDWGEYKDGLGLRSAIGNFLNGVVVDYSRPRPPYPHVGPDPTPNNDPSIDCASYGGGSVLDDPSAEMFVLDATSPGGENDRVTITVAVSNSRPIPGYFGRIHFDRGINGDFPPRERRRMDEGIGPFKDLTGTLYDTNPNDDWPIGGYCIGRVIGESLQFGFLNSAREFNADFIPPGSAVHVAEIELCLLRGTKKGQYAMTLEVGELVDAETARSISPRLHSGILTVEEDLAPEKGCLKGYTPYTSCESTVPPHAVFKLGDGAASIGQTVTVPFKVRSNEPVGGFVFSIDFDEEVLEGIRAEMMYERPDGKEIELQTVVVNSRNDTPGNAGTDEGYVAGIVVWTLTEGGQSIPPDRETEIFRLHFRVRPDTQATSTTLRFLKGGKIPSGPGPGAPRNPAHQQIGGCESAWTPETASSFILIDSLLSILPEISVFSRADSNGDGAVDVADALNTLNYLFLGGENPYCFDAADANDDGAIDVTDPVFTLRYLFQGQGTIPPPSGAAGLDPTEDSLSCLFRT